MFLALLIQPLWYWLDPLLRHGSQLANLFLTLWTCPSPNSELRWHLITSQQYKLHCPSLFCDSLILFGSSGDFLFLFLVPILIFFFLTILLPCFVLFSKTGSHHGPRIHCVAQGVLKLSASAQSMLGFQIWACTLGASVGNFFLSECLGIQTVDWRYHSIPHFWG